MRRLKKTLFTLNIGNYAPEITALTYPLMKYYAERIGADFHIITDRRFPNWPVTYEKLQIYELGRQMDNDWNIYIDGDALIHPECLDWTILLNKDTILNNARDFANVRWRYNNYFLRDGRNWGIGNWFTVASDWCLDLWRPLDGSFEDAVCNIFPTMNERSKCVNKEHLIDDYALSCNVARFGIKAKTVKDLQKDLEFEGGFFYHLYNVTEQEKLHGGTIRDSGKELQTPGIIKVIEEHWKVPEFVKNYGK